MKKRRVMMGMLLQEKERYLAAHPETGEWDLEVAGHYAKGMSVTAIAEKMSASIQTVYRTISKVEEFLFPRKNYFDSLKKYVQDNPPNYGDGEAHSILEMLFCHYEEFNRFDTDAIEEGFRKLYGQMDGKKLEEIDPVIYTTSILCREHEKSGFVEGVKVGVQMGVELYS